MEKNKYNNIGITKIDENCYKIDYIIFNSNLNFLFYLIKNKLFITASNLIMSWDIHLIVDFIVFNPNNIIPFEKALNILKRKMENKKGETICMN